MKKTSLIIVSSLSLVFLNCTKESPMTLVKPLPTTTVTYTNDIKKIFDTNCVSCHGDSSPSGALSLTNYASAKTSMEEGAPDGLLTRISLNTGDAGAMPPNGKLPQSTIDLITKWKTDGLKE